MVTQGKAEGGSLQFAILRTRFSPIVGFVDDGAFLGRHLQIKTLAVVGICPVNPVPRLRERDSQRQKAAQPTPMPAAAEVRSPSVSSSAAQPSAQPARNSTLPWALSPAWAYSHHRV